MPRGNKENHFSDRIDWLRAAVLGANNGIVSTSSLVVGIAVAHSGRAEILLKPGEPASLKELPGLVSGVHWRWQIPLESVMCLVCLSRGINYAGFSNVQLLCNS